MLLRWVSMCVWAGVAASATFWSLRLFTTATPVPAQAQVAGLTGAVRGDLGRVLGLDAPQPPVAAQPEAAADARFNLVGVVSPRGSNAGQVGVALISVDGKPAKAYKLGAVVDGPNVLQNLHGRGASLGPRGGPAVVALHIAPPQAPATGQLPLPLPGGAGARPSQPAAAPPPPNPGPPPVDGRGNQLK
jgi:general secretion pathway protein C